MQRPQQQPPFERSNTSLTFLGDSNQQIMAEEEDCCPHQDEDALETAARRLAGSSSSQRDSFPSQQQQPTTQSSPIHPPSRGITATSPSVTFLLEEPSSEPLGKELWKTANPRHWDKPVRLREPKSVLRRFRLMCGNFVEHPHIQLGIVALILLNAILMGVATFDFVTDDPHVERIFAQMDRTFLCIFTFELLLHFIYRGMSLFIDGWLTFDFIIVVLSWSLESFQIIRAFRIFRALRLITRIDSLRDLIVALGSVIPNLTAITCLLVIIFYVFAVLFTELFRDVTTTSENYFGSLDASLYTCMQLMTLEDWGNIAREVAIEKGTTARIPFLAFIAITGFIVFNLIVAVVCDAVSVVEKMKNAKDEEEEEDTRDREALLRDKVLGAQERILQLSWIVDEMKDQHTEIIKLLQDCSLQFDLPTNPQIELEYKLNELKDKFERDQEQKNETEATGKSVQGSNAMSVERSSHTARTSSTITTLSSHPLEHIPEHDENRSQDISNSSNSDALFLDEEAGKHTETVELARRLKPALTEARSILRVPKEWNKTNESGDTNEDNDDDDDGLEQEFEHLEQSQHVLQAELNSADSLEENGSRV